MKTLNKNNITQKPTLQDLTLSSLASSSSRAMLRASLTVSCLEAAGSEVERALLEA